MELSFPLPVDQRRVIEGFCRWCGKVLSDKRRCYCSAECRDRWINDIYLVEDFKHQRHLALQRDQCTCQKCKMTRAEHKRLYKQDLHAHHIVPRHSGGSNFRDNLLTLCQGCHIELHKEMGISNEL